MGNSLTMSLLVRCSLRLAAGVAGLMLAFCFATSAAAQTATTQSAVESYVNQAVPPVNEEGVLPEGVEWNKPLKAGTLTLPKAPKAKTSTVSKPQPPSLPVGEVKAPQIGKKSSSPVLTGGKTGSSANVMLMQGMKNALQQAGESLAPTPADDDEEGVVISTSPAAASTSSSGLQPPRLKGSEPAAASSASSVPAAAAEPALKYEAGREPRNLVTGEAVQAGMAEATKDEKESGSTLSAITSFFGMDSEAPKATEMQQAPVSLDAMPDKPAVARGEEKAAPSSIFGPPVSANKSGSGACESKVTSWTRECKDAGYPASYTGKITGETRVTCPGGDVQDVWLSNTCAAPSGGPSSSLAESKEEPKAFAESKMEDGRMGPPPGAAAPVHPPADATIAEALSAYSAPASSSSSSAASAPAVAENARVDANCGTSSGAAAEARPVADLCSSGIATEVLGDGPWRWSCKGLNGGMTVSCAAPVAIKAGGKKGVEKVSGPAAKAAAAEDGRCGGADGTGADSAPVSDLCARGNPSRVNGGGPWTWACSGSNGGKAAACNAPKKVDGICGTAAEAGAESMPEKGLCSAGYASAVTGDGPWNWTCSGLHGGTAATCSASPKINAVCGPASVTGHSSTPDEGLCKAGEASKVEGNGPWTWTCSGSQGGASVSCKASTLVDGACGAANGKSFPNAPDDELCAQGKASRVTGSGPWEWHCSGLEGGNTVSCTAAAAREEKTSRTGAACGTAAETAAFQAPSQGLCASGKASAVSGAGPWSWSCSDDDGHSTACTTLASTEGACGTAANVPSAEAPAGDLCASGAAGAVKSDKTGKHWSWQCKGSMGAATVSCSAPVSKPATVTAAEDAKCGMASGHGATKAPKSGLCEEGKASAVRGKGPWTWTCSAKSGRKVNCEAPAIADGVCGSANGSIQKNAPMTGLCASGAPTEVDGTGPWLWSCVGSGGGSSVSCSAAAQAQAKVDGACGAAAGASMTRMPEANLCDSGVPSAVYGEGPWTWTCSGLNGGIASPCSTSRVVPKAPPPPAQAMNGNCGPANGVANYHQPMEGLCSSGTATSVSGDGPWNWNCLGANGGMTVSCTAPLMPPAPIEGACGAANGVTTLTAPKSALCSAGIASAVSGKGPWTWSCSGTNGGGAVSCVAPLAGKTGAPLPSPVTPSGSSSSSTPVYSPSPVRGGDPDEAPPPKAAPAGLVTPRLPTGPLPPLETGTLPDMKASKPLNVPPEASTLPQGGPSFMPPSVKDSAKPSPSLKPPAIDTEGKAIPGARLVLDADVASLAFARGSDQLSQETAKALDKLAGILQSHSGVRITLNAYAGTDGDMSPREARRLSLARALTVRDYLTGKGLPSGRIDVRALGANVPSGDMDRVDVKVN